MKHTKEQLETMDEATLHEAYARVVGGGEWEDGKFVAVVMRDFSIMDTPAERTSMIEEILQGECKWIDFGKRSVGSKALKGESK